MASAETLSLPLPSDSNRHSLGEAPANKPHSDSSGTHRILLVDDDADIRSLVRAFLEAEGYEVFSCGDAHRAHTLFSTRDDIDLLLTDVRMPEISGPELAQTLSALRPGLPVLFMSGAILDDDFEQKLASNNWRFLAKPFLVPTLLSAVHELIAITEQTRKAASQ